MDHAEDSPVHPPDYRPRFQFSLRTLLILMTGLAILLSGLFGGPGWLALCTVCVLLIAVPMVLTSVLIYSRGYRRTFCIGALFPAGSTMTVLSPLSFPYMMMGAFDGVGADPATRLVILASLTVYSMLVIVFGLAAVWIRRMVEPARARESR